MDFFGFYGSLELVFLMKFISDRTSGLDPELGFSGFLSPKPGVFRNFGFLADFKNLKSRNQVLSSSDLKWTIQSPLVALVFIGTN